MARKIRRSIKTASSLILLSCCLFLLYEAWTAYKNSLATIDEYKKETAMYQQKISDIIEENDILSEKVDKTKTEIKRVINEKLDISQIKTQYFDKAKQLEELVLSGESNVKIAYLTFDDGPYYKSEQFLDVLDEYNVPATFFYLMKSSETGWYDENDAYDHIYRRVIESGHTLGNHTASHKLGENSVYQSVDYFIDDILKNRNFIKERYDYVTTVMRFPGGSNTSSKAPAIAERLKDIGYCYVDWNVTTGDGTLVLEPWEFRDNVLKNTEGKNILVVLMHDYSRNTLTALPEIIEGLKEQGYIFLPMFNGSVMCKTEK